MPPLMVSLLRRMGAFSHIFSSIPFCTALNGKSVYKRRKEETWQKVKRKSHRGFA